jgi:hypothetical protein
MSTKQMRPDKVFGQGCDFARFPNQNYAQLFEIKTSSLSQADATRAAKELTETKDILKAKSLVGQSCIFGMWVIHHKTASCRTDAMASVILDKARILLGNSKDSEFHEVYLEWVRLCKQNT